MPFVNVKSVDDAIEFINSRLVTELDCLLLRMDITICWSLQIRPSRILIKLPGFICYITPLEHLFMTT